MANNWWNRSLGFGIIGSTIMSIISGISGLIMSAINLSKPNPPPTETKYKRRINYANNNQIYYRLSKYPSKATIGFMGI